MISRKAFLAGALASPLFLDSRAWAALPSRVPNFGLIGGGRRMKDLLHSFSYLNCRIIAASDCDRTRLADIQRRVDTFYKEHPEKNVKEPCRGYADFRALLADRDIDCVVIATPEHWHATQTILAMRAGKDVYCEKPLAFSVEEVKALMRVERETGRILLCGSQQRSSREFCTAVDLVRNGVIGKVTEVRCGFGGPSWPHRTWYRPENAAKEGAPNPDVDFDMWCGPAPLVPYSDEMAPRGVHFRYPPFAKYDEWFGTGGVGDWGAHHLDIAQWGLGEDAGGPIQALVSEAPRSSDPFMKGRRQYGAQLVFASGARVTHIATSNPHLPYSSGVWFFGTNGMVYVDRGKFGLWTGAALTPTPKVLAEIDAFEKTQGEFAAGGPKRFCWFDGKKTHDRKASCGAAILAAEKQFLAKCGNRVAITRGGHSQNFLDAVASRKRSASDAQIGGRTTILCQLVNTTYMHEQPLDWDPVKMDFAKGGDPMWLARRTPRAQWKV